MTPPEERIPCKEAAGHLAVAEAVVVAVAPPLSATATSLTLDEAGVGDGGIPGGSASCLGKGATDNLSDGGSGSGGGGGRDGVTVEARSIAGSVDGSSASKGACAAGSGKGAIHDLRDDSCSVDVSASVAGKSTVAADDRGRSMKLEVVEVASSRSTSSRVAALVDGNITYTDVDRSVNNNDDDGDSVGLSSSLSPPSSPSRSLQPQSSPAPRRKKKGGAKTHRGRSSLSRSPARRRGRAGAPGRDWAKEAKRRRKLYKKVAKDGVDSGGGVVVAGITAVNGDDGGVGRRDSGGSGGEGFAEDERWGQAGIESMVDLGQWGAGVQNLEIEQR